MNGHAHAIEVARWASVLEDATLEDAPLHAMQAIARINAEIVQVASAVVLAGAAAGLTVAQMAAALDVPESTLRGGQRAAGASR